MVCEDLGTCERSILRLKGILSEGDSTAQFDAEVLDLSESLLSAGVVDEDHHLNNIVVTPSNRLARLDLELARPLHGSGRHRLSVMLAALVYSYLLAIQPETDRANPFILGLLEALKPSRRTLRDSESWIMDRLQRQRQQCGIDTRWLAPWN